MATNLQGGRFAARASNAALCLLCGTGVGAQNSWSTTAATDASPTTAHTRFEADSKLCAAVTAALARWQCHREVQTAYDQAMTLSLPGVANWHQRARFWPFRGPAVTSEFSLVLFQRVGVLLDQTA